MALGTTNTQGGLAAELDAHKAAKNPHGITKDQVGLGSVPNVATNDQQPTYAVATALAELASGENLSVAMGKIARAVADLKSHIGAVSGNPHKVTASEVGAVPTSRTVNGKELSSDIDLAASDVGASSTGHKHSAGDVTSGTLPIARGGTGAASASAALTALGAAAKNHTHPAAQVTGACQIQTGSYVGTGTYGSSNPCKLTFNFVPKVVVIVQPRQSTSYDGSYDPGAAPFILMNNATEFSVWIRHNGSVKSDAKCYVSWSSSSVQWYIKECDPDYQCNAANQKYYWFALS